MMTDVEKQELATAIAQAVTVGVMEALSRRGGEAQSNGEKKEAPDLPAGPRVISVPPFEPEPDEDEAAAQEVSDMQLELELGYGFAPDEEKRAAVGRLLEMLKAGDVERVKELGRRFGLFQPETLAALTLPAGPPAVQTPEQRRAQEALAAQRLAGEVPDGAPPGEMLEIATGRPVIGGWGRSLARGASQRIAERRTE